LAYVALYNHQNIKLNEIVEVLSGNFSSPKDAYDYLAGSGSQKQSLTLQTFSEAMANLFPKRFTDKELEGLWRLLTPMSYLSYQNFLKIFEKVCFSGSVSLKA
jgi:hypothetical protein